MISYFEDLSQTVTSETRLMTSDDRKDMLRFFADNFLQERDRIKIRTPSCFSARDASKLNLFTPIGQVQNLTLSHVTSRSSVIKIGQNAYQSTRLDELNELRPSTWLSLLL